MMGLHWGLILHGIAFIVRSQCEPHPKHQPKPERKPQSECKPQPQPWYKYALLTGYRRLCRSKVAISVNAVLMPQSTPITVRVTNGW